MNIAIIGTGFIGRKRAQALTNGINLSVACDIDKRKADSFASEFKCESENDWRKVIGNPKIQAVIVSTTNNYLSIISEAAILQGKHVLIEKPGARNLEELQKIAKAYQKRKVVVMFGYNHRFHPAIMKAKEIIDSKKYGPVLFIRAKYGHGGRLGYEKEWRFNKNISGGGELLDQGSHLIDLTNYFIGELDLHNSYIGNFYWHSDLEDLAFMILKRKNVVANLSVSCIEWKNIFTFEIMLKNAKIQIDGLGGSYGDERLTLFEMGKKMGPPKIKEFSFSKEDLSWKKENEAFLNRIKLKNFSDENLQPAIYVMNIINKIYNKNKL